MLRGWTDYIEQIVRLTDENRAACRRTEEEFQTKSVGWKKTMKQADKGALLGYSTTVFRSQAGANLAMSDLMQSQY